MFYDCLDTRQTTFGASKGAALARKSQHLSKCHDTLVLIAYAQNPIGPSLCSSCLLKARDLFCVLTMCAYHMSWVLNEKFLLSTHNMCLFFEEIETTFFLILHL